MLSDSANYDRTMKRSTRVLSKFNEEQRKSAFESIKSSMIVVAGAQLIYKGMSSILGKLQASINKFTYAPLMEGLNEYTTQLENFQAIVQNTSQWFDSGDTVGQIEAITGSLDELNAYADKTIYKYSDMMNAVKGFTTAGLTIEDSTSIAQGLASLTAYMGEGAQQYASAAYMFNQAIQQGKMQWYQWRSIEQTAGIGGEKTKKLMIETAKAMGKDAPDWNELSNIYSSLGGEEADNTFRDSLKDDWLTADVLLESMKILNGEFDDATLKAQGFSDEIIKMSHDAVIAAGQVRTYGQFMDTVVESIGTGWSQIFRALFGDVSVATKMWTSLMNTVTNDIKVVTDLISDEAKIFSDLGGRNNIEKILNNVWTIIKNIGKSLVKVVKIFVPEKENGELKSLGEILYDISESIVKITDVLAGNVEPTTNFQKALSGIGETFSFLFGLIKRIITVLQKLGAATKPIWDGIMGLIVRLGPQLRTLLENIVGFIEKLADSLINSGIFQAIGNIFTGASDSIDSGLTKGISGFFITIFESISNALKGVDLDGIFGAIINMIEAFTGMFDESGDNTESVFTFIKFAAAIWLAVKMLKPVFKDIASVAKSYKNVGNQFWSIMGAVLAVLIAFEMFNQIKMGNVLTLWVKMEFLAAAISLLARSITKVSNAAGDAWTLIPLLLFIGGIVAAAVYGLLQAQEAGYDLDQLIEVLKVISTILKSLALLIGSIALLLFAISLKQFVAAKYGKKALKAAQENKDIFQKIFGKDTWDINTKSSISVNFLDKGVQYILGISVGITALGAAIKMISDAISTLGGMDPDSMWRGVGAISIISLILAVLIAAITVFSKLQSPKTKEFSTGMKGFKQNGKNNSKNKNNNSLSAKSSESGGLGGLLASIVVITAAIVAISWAVTKLAELDYGSMLSATGVIIVISIIVGAMIILIGRMAKKLSNAKGGAASLDKSVVASLIATLSAIVLLGLAVAAIGQLDYGKMWSATAVILVLAAIVLGMVAALKGLSKTISWGIDKSVIVAAIVVLSALIGLGLTARLLGGMDPEKIWMGVGVLAVLALIVTGVVALLQVISKIEGAGIKWQTIVTLGVIIASLTWVGLLAAGLGLIPPKKLWPGIGAMAAIAALLVVMVAALQLIGKFDSDGPSTKTIISFAAVAAGLVFLVLACTILVAALAGIATLPNVDGAIDMLRSLVGAMIVLSAVLVILGKLSKNNIPGILIGLISIIAIIGVMAILVTALESIGDVDYNKLWTLVGVILALSVIVGIFAAIYAASAGMGAAAGLLAVVTIIGIAAAMLIMAVAAEKVADAFDKASIAIHRLVSAFQIISNMQMGKFRSQLMQLVDSLKLAMPTLARFVNVMKGFDGDLVFAAGDMTVQSTTLHAASVGSVRQATGQVRGSNVYSDAYYDSSNSSSKEEGWTSKFKKGAINVGEGIGGFIVGLFMGMGKEAVAGTNEISNTANGMNNGGTSSATGINAPGNVLEGMGTIIDKLDISNLSLDTIGTLLGSEGYESMDMSSLYTNQYYPALKDAQLNNASLQDVYDAIGGVQEAWRNGAIENNYDALSRALKNAISGMVVNLDDEMVGKIMDEGFGDVYTSQ